VTASTNFVDRLSGRVALAVAAGLVLLIVLVGWFVLVAPKRAKAAELDEKTTSAQVELVSTQRFLKSSSARKKATQLERLTRAVPPEARMSEILRQLSQAAHLSGVRVDGVTPGVMVPTTGGQAIPMTVIAEGHYFRLQKFVHVLRAAAVVDAELVRVSGRLLGVDSIQFSNGASGSVSTGTKGLITATLAVNAFVSTPGQGAAGAGTIPTTSP
jgi:Tfp pilus assembly protein PilO